MYNSLAGYYDALVKDDQATKEWADWITERLPEGSLLDCACGSGEIDRCLVQRGLDVTALDLSEEMLEQARQKINVEMTFLCRDMKDLSGLGLFDGISCLCDSFNYLLSEEDVQTFFEEVFAHLKPGGWFFFDTHSMDRLEEFKEEWNETGTFEDGVNYQWSIQSEDTTIYQDFAFYQGGQVIQEHHMQRVYDPVWLQEILKPYAQTMEICTDFHAEGIQPGEKIFFRVRKKEVL